MISGNGREAGSGLGLPAAAQRSLEARVAAELAGRHIWTAEDDLPKAPAGTEHLHWTIQAFVGADPDGALHDVAIVEVEASTEPEAIARAMQVLQRNGYRVFKVSESCSLDPDAANAKVK
jgi:hypothetical protein